MSLGVPRGSLGGSEGSLEVAVGSLGGLMGALGLSWGVLGQLWGPICASLAASETIEKPLVFVAFPATGVSLGNLGDSDLAQIGQMPWTDK